MNKVLDTYCLSLDYLEVSGAELLELLAIRDRIFDLESTLSLEEKNILSKGDRKLIDNAKIIYQEISQFINLYEHRQNHRISPQKWWWYLDVLVSIHDYLIPVAA